MSAVVLVLAVIGGWFLLSLVMLVILGWARTPPRKRRRG